MGAQPARLSADRVKRIKGRMVGFMGTTTRLAKSRSTKAEKTINPHTLVHYAGREMPRHVVFQHKVMDHILAKFKLNRLGPEEDRNAIKRAFLTHNFSELPPHLTRGEILRRVMREIDTHFRLAGEVDAQWNTDLCSTGMSYLKAAELELEKGWKSFREGKGVKKAGRLKGTTDEERAYRMMSLHKPEIAAVARGKTPENPGLPRLTPEIANRLIRRYVGKDYPGFIEQYALVSEKPPQAEGGTGKKREKAGKGAVKRKGETLAAQAKGRQERGNSPRTGRRRSTRGMPKRNK